jgi:microcystin-dependent protein
MSEPFISEIRMFGFNFAPRGWAFCNGQILPITQNQPLYALIGNAYGGDGVTTFGLPELRGRVPMHVDPRKEYAGDRGIKRGLEAVALTTDTLGTHSHPMFAANEPGDAGRVEKGGDRMVSLTMTEGVPKAPVSVYGPPTNLTSMASGTTTPTGGGEVHNNVQPSQVVNFCIALQGVFPSRT